MKLHERNTSERKRIRERESKRQSINKKEI